MAVSDEIKEQTKKLKDMTFKEKVSYIWEYYKAVMIIAVIVIVGIVVVVRDIRNNSKPTHFYAVFVNSNFRLDDTNTLEDDYIRCMNVDTDKEHVFFSYDIYLDPEYFDTTSLAYQQKLVSLYSDGDVDVVAGPVDIMESSADCNEYADLEKVLPKDLLDELEEKGYELYYYPGHRYSDDDLKYLTKEEIEALDDQEPYAAGIYLDNCSYLSNMGEYGAYDLTDDPDKRAVITIPATTKRLDRAIEFIRFITE